MLAVVVSMLLLIRRAATPHGAILGRVPGTRIYSDIKRNPDSETIPGALVFRIESALLYFNAEHVRECVRRAIRSAAVPPAIVVGDLSSTPAVDLAGARMLAALHAELQAAGMRLRLVGAHSTAREIPVAVGLEERIGYFGRNLSVADVVDEFQGSAARAQAPAT
jgi:SulP family sulfate permease